MTNIIAVIGAGYGDEGKGLFTDYFANQHNDSIICRSNGGAQAGHTVVTPNGIRHVFSHLGAGSFSDKPTFLSEHFICNPLLFKKEYITIDEFVYSTFIRNTRNYGTETDSNIFSYVHYANDFG